jgi:GTP-binding protein
MQISYAIIKPLKINQFHINNLMGKPIVAIVGVPNVGKSTLFNRIVKKRRAIIEDYPGITRDRLYGDAEWNDKPFIVIDTGGFQHRQDEQFAGEVTRQVMMAVEEADVLIMMMDAEKGILPLDVELIETLRRYGKRIFYTVNKIDGPKKEANLMSDFYSLGVDLCPISALNGNGYEDLMDHVSSVLPEVREGESDYPKIAIVGRPNVGKSTLVNSLLSKERMIVSSVPGTTRDAVDSLCTHYNKKYILIDTAGIRRKGRMAKTVERYSFMRTLRNIENCDVAVIVLDAPAGVVELDQKIAGLVHEARKGSIILLNKWDLVDKDSLSIDDVHKRIYRKLWFMKYSPILTTSALSKQRVSRIFPIVNKIITESAKRINTHELNLFLRNTIAAKEPQLYRGNRVKIHYISQVKTNPPGFVIFTNKKSGIKEQYIKFMESRLRAQFPFEGTPVEFYVRQKKQK